MKAGRPKISDDDKFSRLQDIFLQVGNFRHKLVDSIGKDVSGRRAADLFAERGGLIWIRGGKLPDCSDEGSKQRRYDIDAKTWRLKKNPHGKLFVERAIQHAASIRARYDEACALYRRDAYVRRAWDNLLADMLGLPRKPPIINLTRARVGS